MPSSAATPLPQEAGVPSAARPPSAVRAGSLFAVFFLSGFTSLCYEIVYAKQLGYVFGTSAYAISTVLAAFMGGLALGSWAGGSWSTRLRRPVLAYGVAELGVGLYGLLTPLLFAGLGKLYAWVGPMLPQEGGALLTAGRFVLATLLILPPTFFMGCTFPLLTRRFGTDVALGKRIGQLYTVNTLGAAAGTLFSTYVLLAALGIRGTLFFTALLNGAIFVWALWWQRQEPAVSGEVAESDAPGMSARPTGRVWPIYLLAAFSGFLTLSFENVWSHVLALLVGTSSYAFGIVLSTFLVGLTVGGALVTRLLANAGRARVLHAVVAILLAISASAALTHGWWERVPALFAVVGWFEPGFWMAELTRGAVSFGLIALPIVLMGMLFPAGLMLLREFGAGVGRRVGVAYVFNTVGTIFGSVATGFFLLEALGSEETLRLLAVLPLLAVLALLPFVARWPARLLALGGALFLALLSVISTRWDVPKMSDGSHIYFQPGYDIERHRVVFLHEDVHSGFTMVVEDAKVRTLMTNGKFEGNDGREKLDQVLFALAPSLYAPSLGRAANIGVGTGQTLQAIRKMGFAHTDAVDTSNGILAAASNYFWHINAHALRARDVTQFRNDGRNHLVVNREPYDLIGIELTSVWFANAGNLYSREFYELCRRNLTPGGVLQQWVQLHHISLQDVTTIIATLKTVFPHVELWLGSHQGVLIASERPLVLEPGRLDRALKDDYLRPLLLEAGLTDRARVESHRLIPAAKLDGVLARLGTDLSRISDDDNLLLEYSTPRGNHLPDAFESNLDAIRAAVAATP